MKMLHQHHRNRRDDKKLLRKIICQQNVKLERNEKIFRNVHSSKIEAEQRSRKYKQNNCW